MNIINIDNEISAYLLCKGFYVFDISSCYY